MKKIDQIILLLQEAREQLWVIRQLYEQSILEEELNLKLHAKIKNFIENLRSSFDYVAHIIHDEYCSNNVKGKIHFPIPKNTDKTESALKLAFPNLDQTNTELFDYLLNSQSPVINNEWFRELRDLSNLMKHNELPIQARKDLIICRITNQVDQSTTWETSRAKLEDGTIHLVGGGSFSMKAANYKKYRDPLEIDSYGWKIADLPLDEMKSEEIIKISQTNKVEYYQAGNFYFNFDLKGKNIYNKLFSYYSRTWKKLNLIYLKMYPDEQKIYERLFNKNEG